MIKTVIASLLSSITIGSAGSAIINIAPTHSVGTQSNNGQYGDWPDPIDHTYTNNDKDLVVDGKASIQFSDPTLTNVYRDTKYTITLTSQGVQSLVDQYKADTSFWGTGTIIMDWFNHKVTSFDNLYLFSFLNILEGHAGIPYSWGGFQAWCATGLESYLNFRDELRQPADTIYKLVKMTGKLPELTATFDYNYGRGYETNFTLKS